LFIFKTILETHDVGMFKCAVNLDLGIQLLGYEQIRSTDMVTLALPLSLPSWF
jgi:hypothetical protein